MDNQHRKIAGYRELSQVEINLMNRIKAKGQELLDLHDELIATLHNHEQQVVGDCPSDTDVIEYDRFQAAEPFRWAEIGKTDIQTGVMALVRAVAQPATC